MSFAIDWTLFVILLVFVVLIAWAAYQVGVEEGWRQAGRWADWESVSDKTGIGFADRPATREYVCPLCGGVDGEHNPDSHHSEGAW